MAAVVHNRAIDRRDFIKGALAGIGAVVTLGGCNSVARRQNPKEPLTAKWALLSDTHIPEDAGNKYREFYPYSNLEKIVPDVIANAPDAVAITGDLARLEGKPGDYANLKKLITPLADRKPVFMALGNHDHRDNFVRTFEKFPGAKQPVHGKCVLVAETPPVRLIMLDSLFETNKTPGLLGKAQRQWLAKYLEESDDTPTLLCFHHTLGDNDGDLLDILRLYEMVKPIRNVKAIVYGHSHVYGFDKYEDIHLINLPASGYNFSDAQPVGWIEANLTAQGGQFILHARAGNTENDGSQNRLTWRA